MLTQVHLFYLQKEIHAVSPPFPPGDSQCTKRVNSHTHKVDLLKYPLLLYSIPSRLLFSYILLILSLLIQYREISHTGYCNEAGDVVRYIRIPAIPRTISVWGARLPAPPERGRQEMAEYTAVRVRESRFAWIQPLLPLTPFFAGLVIVIQIGRAHV